MLRPIKGIFGGTFDPVHYGHLRVAIEILDAFALEEVRLMPCGIPPHQKTLKTSNEQRLAMLRLGLGIRTPLKIDDREIRRAGASYTVDTLQELKAEFPDHNLAWILGADAFLHFTTWRQWEKILELAHLIVARRPNFTLPEGADSTLLLAARQGDIADLHQESAGRIALFSVTQLDISSSKIRQLLENGQDSRYLLPNSVLDFIQKQGLYGCAQE
jgi:nicotinate-nucleotide adenylyltransferase